MSEHNELSREEIDAEIARLQEENKHRDHCIMCGEPLDREGE